MVVVRFLLPAATGFVPHHWNELFSPGFGNEDLSAQENLSFDLGHKTLLMPGFTASIEYSVSHRRYTDLLTFDPNTFQSINIGDFLQPWHRKRPRVSPR